MGEVAVPGGVKGGEEAEDFGDGHPTPHVLVLGEVADGAADGESLGGGVKVVDADFAGVGGEKAHEHADGGGFAGTVAAEEGVGFAFGDGKVDALQDGMVAKGFGDGGELDGGHGGLLREF